MGRHRRICTARGKFPEAASLLRLGSQPSSLHGGEKTYYLEMSQSGLLCTDKGSGHQQDAHSKGPEWETQLVVSRERPCPDVPIQAGPRTGSADRKSPARTFPASAYFWQGDVFWSRSLKPVP